jgi:RNA polymerase sigma-B factor
VGELAEYLELPREDVLTGLDAGTAHYSVSLDAPVSLAGEEEPDTLGDSVGDVDETYGLVETTLSLSAALRRLPYLERQALTLRLEQDRKQTEIAQELGCSQMQVSRLLRRAAARLRKLTDPDLDAAVGLGSASQMSLSSR